MFCKSVRDMGIWLGRVGEGGGASCLAPPMVIFQASLRSPYNGNWTSGLGGAVLQYSMAPARPPMLAYPKGNYYDTLL